MFLFHSGPVEVHAVVAPTLNFVPGRGLRCAVSFDDQPPQAFHLVPEGYNADNGNADWENSVRRNARIVKTTHTIPEAGYHTLRFWMVDPGVVLQKLVVNTGGLQPSYLGPPESYFNKPKPGDAAKSEGAYNTGRYRNLFAEAGYSPDQISAKLNGAFEQFFHGDPQTQSVYFTAGQNQNGPLAYICDINNDNIHSEGMSYGMMIAVQMDKKAEFDALWNWAQTYMFNDDPKHPAFGYFSWSMNKDGTPKDQMPAPDGEEYFAMALYFADGRWGSGTGIYDYKARADRLLTDMLHRQPITGPTVTGIKTGFELFDTKHKMVRFTPDSEHCDHTDPSYHLPGFYELWALWGPPADRPFWAQAAQAGRDFFEKAAHPVTGLAPDYANFDGSPWAAPWKPSSADFQFDSWRTAMNWAFDWAWWAKDPRAVARSNRIQAFFQSQGMDTYVGQYTLDGRPFGDSHPQGLVAANAIVSLAADHPRSQQFVRALWNLPIPSGRYRYYDGMLTMMALLHGSGNFRIWPPQSISQ
jgi:oligosaccharide reducing-end xylanase